MQFFREKFNLIQKKVEDVLNPETEFQFSFLNELIYNSSLPLVDKMKMITQSIANSFSICILLQAKPNAMWEFKYVFANSHLQTISSEVALPSIHVNEIKKLNPYLFLRNTGLLHLCDETDSLGAAFKLNKNYVLILFSNLPKPWFELQIDELWKTLKFLQSTHE